jgi:hypothetical protein
MSELDNLVLSRGQAVAVAQVLIPALRDHAKKHLAALRNEGSSGDQKGFAALEVLAGIEGTFCAVAPEVINIIDDLGMLAQYFYGPAYAILQAVEHVLKRTQAVVCVSDVPLAPATPSPLAPVTPVTPAPSAS